ncbi:MAG: HAD hydrolase family protein [Lachnospiraceae bacterium]|nr:HAD hydrolase family protein [Lachnospiraceae bacterium]
MNTASKSERTIFSFLWRLPHPGMRILKSAAAIILCYFVSFLRGDAGIVFYSQLAALWCIQMYTATTFKNAYQRMIGTIIGAVFGLIFLLARGRILTAEILAARPFWFQAGNAAVISAMIILILYTTVLIKKKQASYFSCVVFLSIVVNHAGDLNPYLFVWNRFLDTVVGILIGLLVNTFSLPRRKRKDILFVSGLDGTLLDEKDTLSDFSRVELNRMLDEGANFTISTMRTPASLLEPMRDVRLRLPVIVMDGAALYDIQEKRYLKKFTLTVKETKELLDLAQSQGLMCFTNVILQDAMVIYYQETDEKVHGELIARLRRSPLRNYVCRRPPEDAEAVYLMLLYPKKIIRDFYHTLEQGGFTERFKILCYDSTNYPGCAYIKIYNREASREHMLTELEDMIGMEQIVTFGSIPGKYDVVVEGDLNRVVRVLRKRYEPVTFGMHRAGKGI